LTRPNRVGQERRVDRIKQLELAGVPSMCAAMLLGILMETLPRFMSKPYSAFEVVWMRYSTHLLLMVLVWGTRHPSRLVRTTRPGLHAIRGLTMLGMPAAYVLAISRAPKEVVQTMFTLEPLMAMVMAAVWLRERIGHRRWAGGVAACVGALVIAHPTIAARAGTIVLGLSVAACFALYQVLTRFMREETTTSRLFYTALWVWVPLGFAVPWFWTIPALTDLVLMMLVGVLGYLILLGIDRSLDVAPVSKIAPFAVAQPVAGVLIEALLLRRVPPPERVAGIAIVFVGWLMLLWPTAGQTPTPDRDAPGAGEPASA
jgi:drug/metabolite transporter (DMT)-like permease